MNLDETKLKNQIMKHYKIFGSSLQDGIQKIGYTDVLVEIMGILMHALSLSPYAASIQQVLSQMNVTDFPLPNFDVPDNMTTLCGFQNGSHTSFNICIGEFSLGVTGILIHVTQLVIVFVVLKAGKERNVAKCKLWVKMTTALTILDIGVLVCTLLLNKDEKIISYTAANIIYKLYSCGLISAYISDKNLPQHSNLLPENNPVQTTVSVPQSDNNQS